MFAENHQYFKQIPIKEMHIQHAQIGRSFSIADNLYYRICNFKLNLIYFKIF